MEPVTKRIRGIEPRSRRRKLDPVDFVIFALMIVISVVCLFPLLHTIAVSFSASGPANGGMVSFYPVGFNVENYQKIMEDQKFLQAFWVSLKRVAAVVAVSFFLTVLLAYPLSKETKKFYFRNVYIWVLVFVMMFHAGTIPFYMTMRELHLLNTFPALVLPMVVNVFNVILVINFFRSVPRELDESANIDGAGPWRLLFQIYVPLSIPVLATVTLFSIVFTWNEYFLGLIMVTDESLIPLQTYIQSIVVQIDPTRIALDPTAISVSNKTLNAAKIFVTMIPIMMIYPFLQRYFITGIMLGSVKE